MKGAQSFRQPPLSLEPWPQREETGGEDPQGRKLRFLLILNLLNADRQDFPWFFRRALRLMSVNNSPG